MTTPDENLRHAIEAAARAWYAEFCRQVRVNGADTLGQQIPDWDELDPKTQRRWLAEAEVHIAAALPHLRRAWAEEGTEVFAFDHGAFIIPISADDARAIKAPENRKQLRHAYQTEWEPLDEAREIGGIG